MASQARSRRRSSRNSRKDLPTRTRLGRHRRYARCCSEDEQRGRCIQIPRSFHEWTYPKLPTNFARFHVSSLPANHRHQSRLVSTILLFHFSVSELNKLERLADTTQVTYSSTLSVSARSWDESWSVTLLRELSEERGTDTRME